MVCGDCGTCSSQWNVWVRSGRYELSQVTGEVPVSSSFILLQIPFNSPPTSSCVLPAVSPAHTGARWHRCPWMHNYLFLSQDVISLHTSAKHTTSDFSHRPKCILSWGLFLSFFRLKKASVAVLHSRVVSRPGECVLACCSWFQINSVCTRESPPPPISCL